MVFKNQRGDYFIALGVAKHKASCCDKARSQNVVLILPKVSGEVVSNQSTDFSQKKLVGGCVPHTSIRVPL